MEVPARKPVTFWELLAATVPFVIFASSWWVVGHLASLQDSILGNRATICEDMRTRGVVVPAPCSDPAVVRVSGR